MSSGEVLFGTDSHTCNAGAFGQFATGIGNTDAGFILGTGKLLIKVAPSLIPITCPLSPNFHRVPISACRLIGVRQHWRQTTAIPNPVSPALIDEANLVTWC